MAVAETGYEQRVGPGGSTPTPTAGAAAFGGQVGAALTEVGDTMHAAKLRAYQVERKATADREGSEAALKLAQLRADTDKAEIDARANSGPGAAGHTEAMSKLVGPETLDALTAGITEDSVRQRMTEQYAAFAGQVKTRAYEYETGAASAKVATDAQKMIEIASNRVRANPSAWLDELTALHSHVGALHGVDDATRAKLGQFIDQSLTGGYVNGEIDRGNAAAMVKAMDSGAYAAMLSPEQVERFRNEGRIAVDRIDLETRAATNQAKADAREQIATFNAEVDAGIVKTPEQAAQIARMARAIGDTSGAVTQAALSVRIGVNKQYENAPAALIQADIAKLQADTKRGADGDVKLAALSKLLPARLEQERTNPLGIRAANGMPITPLSDEPGSWRQRGQEAIATAKALNGPIRPFNGPVELAQRQEMLRGSPKDRLTVAEEISRFGNPAVIKAAARQLAPNDAAFQRAVTLGTLGASTYMRAALNGPDALKASPGIWDESEAAEIWSSVTAAPLSRMPRDWVAGLRETAKNIYASNVSSQGGASWHPDNYRIAIQQAMGRMNGAGGKTGGLAEYRDAQNIALPDGMGLAELQRRIYRSTPEDFRRATGTVPQAVGGPSITIGQFRALKPVMVGDGIYAFEVRPNAFLASKRGGVYSVDVRKLPLR